MAVGEALRRWKPTMFGWCIAESMHDFVLERALDAAALARGAARRSPS